MLLPSNTDYYHYCKRGRGGLYSQCKTCVAITYRQYYRKNRDELLKQKTEYYYKSRRGTKKSGYTARPVCGVFSVLCVPADRVYIGTSKNLKKGILEYMDTIREGSALELMVKDRDAYGVGCFQVSRLAEYDTASHYSLSRDAQRFMKKYKEQGLYVYNENSIKNRMRYAK
jgi:hypothetical protein